MAMLLAIGIGLLGSIRPAFADHAVGDIYTRPLPGFNKSVRKTRMLNAEGKLMTNIVYGLEEAGGRVAVCGMVLHAGEVDRRAFAGVMANSGVGSGGIEFITDLRYFREFIAPDRLLLACRVTQQAWEPHYAHQPAELIFRGEFGR